VKIAVTSRKRGRDLGAVHKVGTQMLSKTSVVGRVLVCSVRYTVGREMVNSSARSVIERCQLSKRTTALCR
jgi:hypothetical protein